MDIREAEFQLQSAYNALQRRHHHKSDGEAELRYSGLPSASSRFNSHIRDIEALITYAKTAESRLDEVIRKEFPAVYNREEWKENVRKQQEELARRRIEETLKMVDRHRRMLAAGFKNPLTGIANAATYYLLFRRWREELETAVTATGLRAWRAALRWRTEQLEKIRTYLKAAAAALVRGLDSFLQKVDEVLTIIRMEERGTEEYLQKYCPAFQEAVENSHTQRWMTDEIKRQENGALDRLKLALKDIDGYAIKRGVDFAGSLKDGVIRRVTDLGGNGFGRPWGTEIRQRIAIAVGLKEDVNSIWQVGLNSVANSKQVRLRPGFIRQIKEDNVMNEFIGELEKAIEADIVRKAHKAPYIVPQELTSQRIRGITKTYAFGGKRHKDDMIDQLKFTIRNPRGSMQKYADTWNVAFSRLTWVLRNCSVSYRGIYHAVYNVAGYAYVWEMELSIEDTLDLRPRGGGKLNFGGDTRGEVAYNIATSILGTFYHDIIGNSDTMKVRAKWHDTGNGGGRICKW